MWQKPIDKRIGATAMILWSALVHVGETIGLRFFFFEQEMQDDTK